MVRGSDSRVVISGVGVVSPFGIGREQFWTHVSRGCSATRSITHFDTSAFSCSVAAPVPPITVEEVPAIVERASGNGDERSGRADPRRYSRASLIAVIAAAEAWQDAGL